MSLCIRCGTWKQAPLSTCACGFKPAGGTDDEAKSFILSPQFRTPEALEEIRRGILAGEPPAFGDKELEVARTIGAWNGRVTLAFLGAAVLTGLALGSIAARMPLWFILGAGALAVVAFALAFRLMAYVDGKVKGLKI